MQTEIAFSYINLYRYTRSCAEVEGEIGILLMAKYGLKVQKMSENKIFL